MTLRLTHFPYYGFSVNHFWLPGNSAARAAPGKDHGGQCEVDIVKIYNLRPTCGYKYKTEIPLSIAKGTF